MRVLLKNGRLIDPSRNYDGVTDILVERGKVVKTGKIKSESGRVIDISGKLVIPGMIDLHTHLREPGREDAETIKSGTRAAAKGGFTTVCAMPNTDPPVDSVSGVKYILSMTSQEGSVQVLPVGAITKSRLGEELTEIGKMVRAGAVAVTDDGTSVMNALVMRRAMEYCKIFSLVIMSHSEDLNLSRNGVMNEGSLASRMGLRGIPPQAEEVMVARDLSLSELTGARLHLSHISTGNAVDLIRQAKKKGVNVTAEVTPHHLLLNEDSIEGYNTYCKVNPPLRKEEDRLMLIEALKDGTIDCIATDHAPHLDTEKNREFDLAPFGINGLETAFGSLYTELVDKGDLPLETLIQKMTSGPAGVMNLKESATLKKGADASLTVIDTERKIKVTKNFFRSKSWNSPFLGKHLKGLPVLTLYKGKTVWNDRKAFT